jgi:hypothetical protein
MSDSDGSKTEGGDFSSSAARTSAPRRYTRRRVLRWTAGSAACVAVGGAGTVAYFLTGDVMTQGERGMSARGTATTFLRRGTCSECLVAVLDRAFAHPAPAEERASGPLAGGIAQYGYQCGQVWGAALAAGAQAYCRFGATPQAETKAIMAAQRAVASFRGQNRDQMNCLELTDLDRSSSTMKMVTFFLLKGGTIACVNRAVRFAPVALREINAEFAKERLETPPAPVSCAALLARRMGATDFHATMAAGLAGGIGLSGGACGALGAAIWLAGLDIIKKGGHVAFRAPHVAPIIERFLPCTGYEFECSKICGRSFATVADHAAHVAGGGCAKIIETLASA